ncbi:ferredoxin [Stieleria sp.]|uniref:Ferredoxin, 2Fe-2S n=1 Tax=Stieleria magnilauensis TaxID=2527963 RepID=A0ABX5XLI8_9BACT|nr:Ferredoxin, 2Fe-2S [Planctomycetes bacterium TBK1r]
MNLSSARKKATKLRLHQVEYTLVVCMDRKTAKCCGGKAMEETWRHIKHCCKLRRKAGQSVVLRIKAGCIGVCKGGPIVGVLPDGIWYGDCTPEIIDRIFDEHLGQGSVVQSHVIAAPS